MAPRDREDVPRPLSSLLKLGRRFLGAEAEEVPQPALERRSGKRVPLQLPVQTCLEGGRFQESRTLDVSPRGLALELGEAGVEGQRLSVRFRGSQAGDQGFMLQGQVVWAQAVGAEHVGVVVRRSENVPEALESYRKLMLHYLRHKPLAAELGSGYFEGRCPSCSWVGRVGELGPRCPMCGTTVERESA
jgi:hypothetical protein